MAEFVALPIYGSDGMATGRSLRINVRFFLGSAGVLANRFMEIVDEVPAEIDALDRIVHGLSRTDKSNPWREHNKRHGIGEFAKPKAQEDDVIPDPVEAGRLSNTAFIKEAERQMLENGRLHSVSVEEKGYFGTIELVDKLNDALADQLDIPVELIDVSSKHPRNFPEDWWRPIPGFSKYEMNRNRKIATAADGLSVSVVKGISNKRRLDNALLSDDNGITKRMSVDYLFKKTFPELNQ